MESPKNSGQSCHRGTVMLFYLLVLKECSPALLQSLCYRRRLLRGLWESFESLSGNWAAGLACVPMLFRFSFCRAVEWELEPDKPQEDLGISLSPSSHEFWLALLARALLLFQGLECWGCDSGCRLCGTLASFPRGYWLSSCIQKGSSCLRTKWTSLATRGPGRPLQAVWDSRLPLWGSSSSSMRLAFSSWESSAASLWREWLGRALIGPSLLSQKSPFVKEGIWQVLFGLDEGSNGLLRLCSGDFQCSLCFPSAFLSLSSLSSGVLSDSSVPDSSSSLRSFW